MEYGYICTYNAHPTLLTQPLNHGHSQLFLRNEWVTKLCKDLIGYTYIRKYMETLKEGDNTQYCMYEVQSTSYFVLTSYVRWTSDINNTKLEIQ